MLNKLLIAFWTAFIFVFNPVLALAQTQDRVDEALSISPALIERDAAKGDILSLSLKVTNINDQQMTLYPIASDFIADPREGGSPQFVNDQDSRSFSHWVKFSENKITVLPGERKEFAFNIIVPADAEPGSHYGGIVFSQDDPTISGSTPVAAKYQLGTLIFIKVAGEVVEKGQLISFNSSKSIYDYPPVIFEVKFENQGNVRTKPSGIIEIYNSAGIKEQVIQINKTFGGVLPRSTRRFEESWNPKKWFNIIPRIGKYEARGILTYGLPSTTVKLTPITFWIIPWKFLLLIIFIIFSLIAILALLLRLYSNYIISKYKSKK
jgi:hypothetical protein